MRVTDEMVEAAETPMSDHIASFWRLLEKEHVRILIEMRRDTSNMTYWDSSSFSDDVAKALVADRRAALAEEWTPKVKGLEWMEEPNYGFSWAETPFGTYYVEEGRDYGEPGKWRYAFRGDYDDDWADNTVIPKAAAQADYEKRVLSCLEYTTPPAGIREALEKAAQEAYRICAETRHVSLGDKVASAIQALRGQS